MENQSKLKIVTFLLNGILIFLGLAIFFVMLIFIFSSKVPFRLLHLFSDAPQFLFSWVEHYPSWSFLLLGLPFCVFCLSFYFIFNSKKKEIFFGRAHLTNKNLMMLILKDISRDPLIAIIAFSLLYDFSNFYEMKGFNIERLIGTVIASILVFLPFSWEWSFQSRCQDKSPRGILDIILGRKK